MGALSVLVTGGARYIGSHTVVQLLKDGYKRVVVDSLHNSSQVSITRVKELVGHRATNLSFHKVCFFLLFMNLF